MSTPGIALFMICGFLALLSAVGTIVVKSAIRAAMSLLVHIVALSGLFLTLHAHFLAALQLLVYAGAVVVLFVFVIMMIGPAAEDTPALRGVVVKTGAAALMGIVTLSVTAALALLAPERALITPCAPGQGPECQQFGGVNGFSGDLFVSGVLPFELISILLTVAIVGAIAVARGHTALEAEAAQRRLAGRRATALEAKKRGDDDGLAAGAAAGRAAASGGQ